MPEPCRIALITHGFADGGGVATVARWLAAALPAAGGYTVDLHDLATSRADRDSRALARPGSWARRSLRATRDRPMPHQHWGANAVEVEPMRYRPRREVTAALRGYDLIQVVSGTPAWAAPVLGCGPPVVVQAATLVTWERRHPAADLWRRAMTGVTSRVEIGVLRRAAAVLVENEAMLGHVRGVGQERAHKIYPGLDTGRFAPAGPRRSDGPLLSVCRLADPRKGLDVLIRAYHRLVEADPGVPPLLLAGRGAITGPVAGLIDGLGLGGRVSVRADVPPKDLIGLYQSASVFVQTSHEEGLGLSTIEAMACGLPVVATGTHGARETVVGGVTGWLVDPGEPDLPGAIAGRMRHALSGAGDHAGRRGRARCLVEFSSDACLGRFLDVYDAVRTPR